MNRFVFMLILNSIAARRTQHGDFSASNERA